MDGARSGGPVAVSRLETVALAATIVGMVVVQAVVTLDAGDRLSWEESVESLRSVYWFENRTLFNDAYCNAGWYTTLILIYRIFGFSLHAARYFRIALQAITLVCFAVVLRRSPVGRWTAATLLVTGLSPTLLHFNAMQTPNALDVAYLAICTLLLTTWKRAPGLRSHIHEALLWSVAMFGWLSYPAFAFFLPGLGLAYLWKVSRPPRRPADVASHLFVSAFVFAIPFVCAVLWVANDETFLRGVFRGGGRFVFSAYLFRFNQDFHLSDMFVQADSYLYNLNEPEFGTVAAVPALLALAIGILMVVKRWSLRPVAALALVTIALNYVIANLTMGPFGMRRLTGVVVGLYALYALSAVYMREAGMSARLRGVVLAVLLVLPLHHAWAFVENRHSAPNPAFYPQGWFTTERTPAVSFSKLVEQAQRQELHLACFDEKAQPSQCRYSEIYAGIAGACRWNDLPCKPILGFDDATQSFVTLTPELWDSRRWNE